MCTLAKSFPQIIRGAWCVSMACHTQWCILRRKVFASKTWLSLTFAFIRSTLSLAHTSIQSTMSLAYASMCNTQGHWIGAVVVAMVSHHCRAIPVAVVERLECNTVHRHACRRQQHPSLWLHAGTHGRCGHSWCLAWYVCDDLCLKGHCAISLHCIVSLLSLSVTLAMRCMLTVPGFQLIL